MTYCDYCSGENLQGTDDCSFPSHCLQGDKSFRAQVRSTVSPYKFGGSRRAAMCWLISLGGWADEESGNSEAPTGWFARIGRTILYSDSQGFVWCEKLATEDDARKRFNDLDSNYSAWDCEDDNG